MFDKIKNSMMEKLLDRVIDTKKINIQVSFDSTGVASDTPVLDKILQSKTNLTVDFEDK